MAENNPIQISESEWAEIIRVPEVQEGWGLDPDATVAEFCSMVYGVKFDFMSGSPGYCGDLYIIQSDCLQAPLQIIRVNGKLEITS